MTGGLDWAVLGDRGGESLEDFIAKLLRREYPDAQQMTPDQGDGGIDIFRRTPDGLVVWQIKKYASPLTSGRWTKIKKSWTTFWDTHVEVAGHGKSPEKIAAYYLVTPWTPTEAWYRKFDDLTISAPFLTQWDSDAFIQGLAETYPEITDHFVHGPGGYERFVQKAVTLAIAPVERTGDISMAEAINVRQEALDSLRDSISGNYYVDRGTFTASAAGPPMPRAGEVGIYFRWTYLGNNRWEYQTVVPTHAQAVELEPLSTQVTFLDPPGTEMYGSVQLWREWGVPFTDARASTVQSGGPFAGEVIEESLLSVTLPEDSRRPNLVLRVVNTDGAIKFSIPLTGATATSGASTGWMRLHATTPAQVLTFELRDDKNGKNPKVNLAVGNVDGNDPADVLAEIEMISSIDPADTFFIEMMTGAQMLKGGGLTTPTSLVTHYRPVAAGLVSLQASATMKLVMPDIMEMQLGQFARFESFVAIYEGKAHVGKWQEISMTIPDEATPEQIEAAKSEIRAVSRGEHSPVAIEQPTISLADRSFVLARPIVTSRVSFTPVDDAVIDALGPGETVVVTPGADDSVTTAAVDDWTPDTQIRGLPLNPEVP
ncbi:hypothetical protein [Arthrobacter alpinus]|uniref:hypothetical protein n=1 Tax=Arthrobacter alpinus TaxID=656366 RepID=UPI00164925B0|nr:hypothetical protein [Arthrobacter alpinus]